MHYRLLSNCLESQYQISVVPIFVAFKAHISPGIWLFEVILKLIFERSLVYIYQMP